jgi:hypothetical protein
MSDVARPSWRATAVGVYRLWRDTGFAVGALLVGLVADLAGLEAAVWVVAALTAASGLVVAGRMNETHRPAGVAMTAPFAAASRGGRARTPRPGRWGLDFTQLCRSP